MKRGNMKRGKLKKSAKRDPIILGIIAMIITLIFTIVIFVLINVKENKILDKYFGELPTLAVKSEGVEFYNCGAVNFIDSETIIPRPQNITLISCDEVLVDSSWKIFVNKDDSEYNFSANYLKNKTLEKSNNLISLEIKNLSEISPYKRIIIGNPNENPILKQVAESNNVDVNLQQGFNQGYVLLIKPDEIIIFSNSSTGSFYGVISLLWLFNKSGNNLIYPNTKIIDWPDFKIRGFFGRTPPGFLKEEWLENLTIYKYNMWTHGIEPAYNSSTLTNINTSLKIKKYFIDRHFYPTLMLQPTTVAYFDPNFYEGIYAYNISMKFNETDEAVSLEKESFQLNNTGFENDENRDGVPDYWRYYFTNRPGNWSWDCSQSHSGQCSVKLNLSRNLELEEVGGFSSSSFLYLSDYASAIIKRFDLEPDKLYILSFWAKKTEISESNLRSFEKRNPQISVVMENREGNQYSQSAVVDKNNSWNKYYIKFSTAKGYTKMHLFSRAQGTIALNLWLDDFEIIKITDKLYNVLKTPDTQLHVRNSDRTVEYKEGIDYQLIEQGNINIDNPAIGKTTKIKRIPNGNIPEQAEIKVDYDFGANLNSQQWVSLSDPYYFDAYKNIMVKPSMEILKPEFVFINIDEIHGVNRDSRAKKRGLKNYQLLANFVNNVTKVIKSYDKNVKIMTWDDMQNPFHNGNNENYQVSSGGSPGKMWYALDLLDRELIQIVWWYDDMDYLKKMRLSPELYNKYGFSYFAGPGVYGKGVKKNNEWSSYLSYKYGALGILGHSFFDSVEGTHINANYSWNAIKEYSEQCNPDYIEICDGIDNDCDDIYLDGAEYKEEVWHSNIDEGFNLTNDPFNCGNCSNICYYPKSYASCNNSNCQFDGCYENFYDANNNLVDGCECSITNNGLEICDNIDNNCNGAVDDGLNCGGPSQGSSPASGVTSSCTENWSCSNWGDCINNIQTRACSDLNKCNTNKKKLDINKTCQVEVPVPYPNIYNTTGPSQIEIPKYKTNYIFFYIIVVQILIIIILLIIIRKKHKKIEDFEVTESKFQG
ncbi:MAG: MopE-related protein [Nanoarchaeota archaeon]|nr:MopE-related protein [Nanoarchaeota archaeon]